jgi:putative copper export protein
VLFSVYVLLSMAWVGHASEGADVLPTRSFLFFY